MKKTIKTVMFAFAVVAAGFGSIKAYNASSINKSFLISEDIDALSGCEVYYNKSLVFRCDGEEGYCSGSYTKFGQTVSIQCTGKRVEV